VAVIAGRVVSPLLMFTDRDHRSRSPGRKSTVTVSWNGDSTKYQSG